MPDAPQDTSVPAHDAPPRGGKAKAVPPLIWIVLALLVVMALWGVLQYRGSHVTPGGGQTPQSEQGPTVMPANNQPLPH